MIKQIYEILRDHVLFNRERKRKTVLEERKYFSNLPKAKDTFEESFFKYK